jgi:membrane-associated protein
MTVLNTAELAGPPGTCSEPAAPAALISPAVQPPALRPHDPRWQPWLGQPRARDLLCLAGIALSGLSALAMISLTPALIATRPVLLELLSGSTSSIMAAGAFSHVEGKLQLTAVVAAALPGMMKFDLLFWCAGALWGRRVAEMLARRSRRAASFARQAEQRGSRLAGPAVLLSAFLPVPSPLVYSAAGWVGLRLIPFIILDLIGSAVWAALLAVLGYMLGSNGVAAANLVSHYALAAITGLTAIAIAPHAWHALRSRRASLARSGSAVPGQPRAPRSS